MCSPAGRSTDPRDYPVGRAEYALRDVTTLTAKASAAGPAVGVYVVRLLDTPLPWTRMRMVYRLLGLVRSYGPTPVDAARGRALELDVVDVTKIARMLEQASERANRAMSGARFARDPGEYAVNGQIFAGGATQAVRGAGRLTQAADRTPFWSGRWFGCTDVFEIVRIEIAEH